MASSSSSRSGNHSLQFVFDSSLKKSVSPKLSSRLSILFLSIPSVSLMENHFET